MATRSFFLAPALVLAFAILITYPYVPNLRRTSTVVGIFRVPSRQESLSPEGVVSIENTVHCEDLHFHEPSKLLFTACEDEESTRYSWFPPLANFNNHEAAYRARGSIKAIEIQTLKAATLKFENFKSPFVTHGIDVIDDPSRPLGDAVYIFAVNHRPNPDYYQKQNSSAAESYSVVEVFHHVLRSGVARHIRTVWHELITTPNDIFALSPTSFFVTNDHRFRKGLRRNLEDFLSGAKWSTTVFVQFSAKATPSHEDDFNVQASVALTGLHNNNGLGHGKSPEDILLGSAASGILHLGKYDGSVEAPKITVTESIELDSTVDNPSYFANPFSNATFDASGFIMCGLSRAVDVFKNSRDPQAKDGIMVWKISPERSDKEQTQSEATHRRVEKWNKRLLFQDDGNLIRTSSAAVLIASDPVATQGRRRARLFVTGFLSRSIVAVEIDL